MQMTERRREESWRKELVRGEKPQVGGSHVFQEGGLGHPGSSNLEGNHPQRPKLLKMAAGSRPSQGWVQGLILGPCAKVS